MTVSSARRWGTTIVEGRVNGHPCRMYAERPRALAELLLEAQRWADRPFLVQGARRLTGAEHARAVARVASALARRGVGRGDWVMLQGFNHIEWLVAFWALQCLGASVALGNGWWSERETADVLEDLRPVLAITDADVALPPGVDRLRFADLRAIGDASGEASLAAVPVDEEAPAVAIFSSGTTEKARGVVMSHRSVIANIHNVMRMTGRLPDELGPAHPGTVSLVTMPLFHLGGMQISIMTMLTGGRVVFLEGKFDPVDVLRVMQAEKVRAWGSVPTMVARVIAHPDFAAYDTSSVASVQMGGAAIPHDLRAQVQRHFPASRKRVGSMYGFTEAGGVLATGAGAEIEGRPGCVGRPLPAVEVRISRPDRDGVGEIQARAATAVSGYLGDATPIADADGWVASGDLGRIDAEGRLYVTGRAKDIIIRGGENISSARVEAVLRSHPLVVEVAAVALPHADLGEEVGAAVVLRPGASASAAELRTHAAVALARFELPTRWWISHEPLPVNATGKIAKREIVSRWPGNRHDDKEAA